MWLKDSQYLNDWNRKFRLATNNIANKHSHVTKESLIFEETKQTVSKAYIISDSNLSGNLMLG